MSEPREDAAERHASAAASAAASASASALSRYSATMRRQRLIYFSIVAVIVIAIGVTVGVAWSRGEVAHTTLHTVARGPAAVPPATPNPNLTPAWHTTDRAAIGSPQWNGTIVTFSRHTVRGRNALTGKQTWSYSRSDRTVCTAVQASGITVAIYEIGGNCDEVTALSSATGHRRWTRTLDENGMPLDGYPSYQLTPDTLMITSKTVIYAIYPVSGQDRWTYQRTGCSIAGAVLGAAGALISQNCVKPQCGKLQYCQAGPQLVLRDGYNPNNDKSDTNPDLIKWNLAGNTDVPLSAGPIVSALNPTTRGLDTLQPGTGKPEGTITLTPAPASISGAQALDVSSGEIVWAGGVTYSVTGGALRPLWASRTPSPVNVTTTSRDLPQSLPGARITAPSATGIRTLDPADGHTTSTFRVPAPPAGSRVLPLATGFLVAAPSGCVAYR